MAKYLLERSNLSLDGKFYGYGSVVELTDAQAKELAGIVKPVSDKTPVSKPTEFSADATASKASEPSTPADVKESAGANEDLGALTKKELAQRLTDAGITFDPNATKAQMVDLLSAAQ